MKILIIGNFNNPSWDGSIPDEKHIAVALRNLGHDVCEWQREDINNYPEPQTFDFILISQWSGYPKNFAKNTKEFYRSPVIYWAFDYQFASHEDWHFEMAKEADMFLSPEMGHQDEYRKMGVNFRWFPQSFAPDFLDRVKTEKIYDVTFTGSLSGSQRRYEVLKAVNDNFDLHVFTTTPQAFNGFKNIHSAVLDYDLPELVAQSKINLSVDSFHVEGSWSDRNAQIMACGGFVLFKYVPFSENMFHDYVEYFNTTDECLEKIKYYLEHDKERELIANRAFNYAQERLTATGRVKDLLTLIKNNV